MKKLAILGTSLVILNGCSWLVSPAAASDNILYVQDSMTIQKPNILTIWMEQQEEQKQRQDNIKDTNASHVEQLSILEKQRNDDIKFNILVLELLSTAGKTPYAYSGSTTRGWDCSGLTMWFYAQLGIDIPHSASAQTQIGELVEEPQVGDIIVVREPGRRSYHHAMLYIGDNKVIHSGWGRGDVTEVLSLNDKYFNKVDMKIIRVN